MSKFAIGLDYGTESGRVVDTAVYRYADSVIDKHLPGTTIKLEPDSALQNPSDYIETLKQARRVQIPYRAGFEVGIVVLTSLLGFKCGCRMPGQSGAFGNTDLAREMVD